MLKKRIQKAQRSRLNKQKTREIIEKYQEELTEESKTQTDGEIETSSYSSIDPIGVLFSNSIPRDPNLYNFIPEFPVYEPSVEEFYKPILLINKFRELGEKYGCVKIRAPSSWNPKFSIPNLNKPITTRIQRLADLMKGESFEQNVDDFTFETYKKFAENFSKNYKRKTTSCENATNEYRLNESEFWSLVEDPAYAKEKVEIQYGADLPSRKYGSAFPVITKTKIQTEDDNDETFHDFNLNNISQAENSLFQIITKKTDNISGITSPWVYNGMLFASFNWHVEDMYMHSVNYMHKGAAKTWYAIPGEYKEAFDDYFRKKYAHLVKENPGLLYEIVNTLNPLELLANNIPVYRSEQLPGEFIITYPKAYHSGFSHGYNVSEAVNVASADWISYGIQAVADYAADNHLKKTSFPIEWIVIENLKIMEALDFTLRDRELIFEEYKKIVESELNLRDQVLKVFPKATVKKFDDVLCRYDSKTCLHCQNYSYLSFLSCNQCRKISCPSHFKMCKCPSPIISLNIRFTEEEFERMI